MIFHILNTCTMLALLFFMAKQDWETKTISILPLILFVITSLVNADIQTFFITFMISATACCFKTIRKGIAIADIIIIVCCISRLPSEFIGPFLIILGTSAWLYGACKNRQIPLVPFISLAFFIISVACIY